MKKSFAIFIALIFSILFFGCDLTKTPDTPQVFSGYLYEDCSMTPKINWAVNLFQDYEIGLVTDVGGPLASGYTDSTGYFRFEYYATGTGGIHVREGSNDLMRQIPWKLENGEATIYRHPTCNIQVSLNVINPHAIGDTLIIGNYTTLENMAVPCPLSSGILYTASDFPLLGMVYGGTNMFINWFFTPYNDNAVIQNFTVDKYCGDTIFVSVDIY